MDQSEPQHPSSCKRYNPPYLIPLVEVVGGERTDSAAVEWASRFYEVAAMSVITMDREVPGFIANRLQEALWREALHTVANGEATVAEIDASITEGPGLRWAVMGPMLTFAIAGGEGGMAHMLDHFGPSLKSPWTRLEAPEPDRPSTRRWWPAATRPRTAGASRTWSPNATGASSTSCGRQAACPVPPGSRPDERAAHARGNGRGRGRRHVAPAVPPDRPAGVDRLQRPYERGVLQRGLRVRHLAVRTRLLGVDAKKARFCHELYVVGAPDDVPEPEAVPVATTEPPALPVVQRAGRTAPFPNSVRERPASLVEPAPAWAGRSIAEVPAVR